MENNNPPQFPQNNTVQTPPQKSYKKVLVVFVILAILLPVAWYFFWPHEVVTKAPMCGGIAGIMCPEGYSCKGMASYPDAAGYCEKSDSEETKTNNDRPTSLLPELNKEIVLTVLKDVLLDGNCSSTRIEGKYASCSVDIQKTDDGWTVTIVYDGLYDDSVEAIRLQANIIYKNGQWLDRYLQETQKCQLNRGHQDFSSESCS